MTEGKTVDVKVWIREDLYEKVAILARSQNISFNDYAVRVLTHAVCEESEER